MTQDVRSTPAVGGEPPSSLPRRLPWSLGSGTILLGLNSAMIAVALVPMAAEFGDAGVIAWIVSSLYIAAAVGSPTAGRLADLLGPRRTYLAGLAIVLVASTLGPFVPTAELMIADRVLLGLGASVQFPAAMAIIRQQAERRGARPTGAIGVIALCGQTTAALGPTTGGLVVLLWGWQGIFWVNLPMVALCATLVLAFVPKDARRPRRGGAAQLASLDPLGMLLLVVTLVLLMLGLLSLDGAGPAWLFLAAFVPALALFVWRERRAASPFVDVTLMTRYPQFALTCLRAVATFVSFYCVFYGLPQWLEATRGLDAGLTGLLMLPVFGVGALSTWTATRLGARWHPRELLVIGSSAMVVAGAALAFATGPDAPLWWLAIVCALLGVPNGFNNLGNQLLLHRAVPAEAAGSSSGVYRTAQYIGASLAAVVVAHTLDESAPAGGVHAMGAAVCVIGAVLLAASLVALARLRRGRS
ncbi:MFS transporter [Microbacterium betulae]|uniref:MFS transporter n=1 Tax=Microbacterium betulae TaxID=2981139 RepID=A0AA97I6Y6_9MICO|nr:MFS transporter [Microbacterium sp. AB]WOF23117.1 MFS transporter [Microbacterium sp. AB]